MTTVTDKQATPLTDAQAVAVREAVSGLCCVRLYSPADRLGIDGPEPDTEAIKELGELLIAGARALACLRDRRYPVDWDAGKLLAQAGQAERELVETERQGNELDGLVHAQSRLAYVEAASEDVNRLLLEQEGGDE